MSPETAREIRRLWRLDLLNGLKSRPTSQDILRGAARAAGVSIPIMLGNSHAPAIAHPRHVAIYLTRQWCGFSTGDLARLFRRDHTSVARACRQVQSALDAGDEKIRGLIQTTMSNATGVVSD